MAHQASVKRTASPSGNDVLLTAKRSYPLYDGHGNMIATLGKVGTGFDLANEKRYDAWGAVRTSSGAGSHIVNPNTGYSANIGHKFDGESDMLYMRARYYEPSTGRFISEDPAYDGTNWYVYCGNAPLLHVDPSGTIKFTINGMEFRLDLGSGEDLHIFRNGFEILSMKPDGTNKAGHKIGGWTREMIDTLVRAARSGHPNARKLLTEMKMHGNYGLDSSVFKEAGIIGIAYTSVDAYFQYDPEDFVGIMKDIATGGRY